MTDIKFTKMCGAGNDFIVVEGPCSVDITKLALKSCHRTDGIGADGLIVIEPSKKANAKMRIINADGSEAEMCGNGARCMAAYLFKTKNIKKPSLTFETLAGIIHAKKEGKLISVGLSDPKDYTKNIALSINTRKLRLDYVNTGVPHAVCFVHGLSDIDVNTIGRLIRYHREFSPKGTNVNFVESIARNFIDVRTYERGVEAETRACGTGSVASAIIAYLKSNPNIDCKKNAVMSVKTRSGEVLKVTFDFCKDRISNVWLTGSAHFIAEGKLFLNI
ncbi:MAG: diaminopimelate epimerase [Candidatus Omnitrophota bacterium]